MIAELISPPVESPGQESDNDSLPGQGYTSSHASSDDEQSILLAVARDERRRRGADIADVLWRALGLRFTEIYPRLSEIKRMYFGEHSACSHWKGECWKAGDMARYGEMPHLLALESAARVAPPAGNLPPGRSRADLGLISG